VAARQWKDILNWSTVDMFFIRLFMTRGKEVHRRPMTFSEPPDWRKTPVALGVSSVARWEQPHHQCDTAGTGRARRRMEPNRRIDDGSRRAWGGNHDRKRFGDTLGAGVEDFFLFILFSGV